MVNRIVAEGKLLHGIKDGLLTSANIRKLKRKVHRILVEQRAASGAERHGLVAELGTVTTEIERYVGAIGAGMISPTLRLELEAAEVTKARIEAKLRQTPAAVRQIIDMVPALVDRVHEIVGDFEAHLKHMLGTIPVKGELEGHKRVPYALLNGSGRLLLRATNGENPVRGNSGSGGVIANGEFPAIPLQRKAS